MYYLGWDFIISSLFWIIAVSAFVYTFRERILRFFQNKGNFDQFIIALKNYLAKYYPKLNFDLAIIGQSNSEPSEETRKAMVIDEVIEQYKHIKLDTSKYPKPIDQNLQWGSYVFNCEPNRNKLPKDWEQRKSALLTRDRQECFRCTKKINQNTIAIYMLKPLEKGGKYHLENLIPVCKDCERILSNDPKKLNFLTIKDELYHIAETH